MEDETGALNSNRNMVPMGLDELGGHSSNSSKRRNMKNNPLTKSHGLPNSSTKDGSVDKSSRSNGGGGILGLSGINLDFRKSGNGLRSFFGKSNQGAGMTGLSQSIQFTPLDKQ